MPSVFQTNRPRINLIMKVEAVTPSKLYEQLDQWSILDVREPWEVAGISIEGATAIPLGDIRLRIDELPQHRPTAVICETGVRSAQAILILEKLGVSQLFNVSGGIKEWQATALPVEVGGPLDARQVDRYARHIALPSVGAAGQLALLQASVLVVGAGGLGSPAALYLAAAGIGRLGLCDFDIVERSNLQRQILHSTDTVGTSKVGSGTSRLKALNPDIEVIAIEAALSNQNAESILDGYDVAIDGTDSFDTRYVINDAAQKLGIPVVHGSILRFEGQVTVFPPNGPCYRCLFPIPPPPELAPDCSTAGVLGVLPGVIGSMQATEAIKLVLGLPTLAGRLALYDALEQTIDHLSIRKSPSCPSCA
jgi:molybdopterin/thiamine biosynthesis adenylyltransferase/rhodanese-related sulfurtransferase